jgi:hypothetical protein
MKQAGIAFRNYLVGGPGGKQNSARSYGYLVELFEPASVAE